MTKVGVAGCSYMAAHQDLKRDDCLANSHFTELLAQEFKWDYYTLARGGASNFCISYQVDQLIEDKPDLILLGFTSVDRDDIPINQIDSKPTIWDFDYKQYPDLSALNERFSSEPNIFSSSISTILDPPSPYRESYSIYFNNLYSWYMKLRKDIDTITSTVLKLELSNIPYIFYCPFDTNEWVETRKGYIPLKDGANPFSYVIPEGSYRYHTTAETQITIKEHWYSYIEKFFPKKNT